MNDNGEYKEIKQFSIERYNDNLAVGFDPYAPIAISFPTASGKDFRLSLSGLNPNSGIREITLSSAPVVEVIRRNIRQNVSDSTSLLE